MIFGTTMFNKIFDDLFADGHDPPLKTQTHGHYLNGKERILVDLHLS